MTLDLDKYAFTDGATALSAVELNTRFYSIVRRLHTLELLSIDWDTAIAQVRNYGLARINDAVQPLIDSLKTDLLAVVAQGEAALASQSAAVEAKLVEADGHIASIQASVNAVVAQGEAALASQSAAVNEALLRMAEHEGRRDNPHGVTAAQAGALGLTTMTEVSVTGAVILTVNAFGKMHVVNMAADGTIGLPAAAGHAGELVGIRVSYACTKLVTLDANASELIDGAANRVMRGGESAVLLCDGTGWTKVAGRTLPMACRMQGPNSQSIAALTFTNLTLSAAIVNVGLLSDTANNRVLVRRAGVYRVSGQISFQSPPATATVGFQLLHNGGHLAYGGGTGIFASPTPTTDILVTANAGATFTMRGYHTHTSNLVTGSDTFLNVEEVVLW